MAARIPCQGIFNERSVVSGQQDSHQHWQDVYTGKSPDEVSWFQARPQLSLRLINASGAGRDAPIIDVGGGASVLVACLLDKGYQNLTVLDLSEAALAGCQERLGTRSEQVQWVAADVLTFRAARRFALWHDRALFHFFTEPAQRQAYRESLDSNLASGGELIVATFASDGPSRCSGLDVVQYNADRLTAELGPGYVLLQSVDESHHTPAGTIQNFTYFRLRKT